MTEIQFLAKLLLIPDGVSEDIKKQIIDRIVHVEQYRPSTIWQYQPYMNTPLTNGTCQHEYPNPWMSIMPPHCTKCGQQALHYTTTTLGGGITEIGGSISGNSITLDQVGSGSGASGSNINTNTNLVSGLATNNTAISCWDHKVINTVPTNVSQLDSDFVGYVGDHSYLANIKA
jgi:hypothetical protein